ncbi:MAG: rhomboid family intramembrane serine protease [Candidatus Sulfotelmatobacter sp.]|jgi:rhomboid protease GluP
MANCIRCGRQLPALSFKKICQWCVQHEAAQRGEEGDDAKQVVLPAPWVRRGQSSISLTQILFGANIAVFLAMAFASGSVIDFPGQTMVSFGANYGPYTLSGDWWRLLTYMFLHGGILHIAFNMWCLWDLGALSESLYGRWTFVAVYLITGVAGGLASVGWNPGVLSVGASGAIFGLAGALIASFYLGEFSLPSVAIGGTLRSLLIFAGFNLFFGGMFGGIDNACHIGGLVSGLILGALIARVAPEHDRPLRRAGVIFFVVLLVAGTGFGIQRWRGSSMHLGRAILNAQRNAERKISDLEKTVSKNPQDVSAHYELARQYFRIGRMIDGESELKKVLELQPQNSNALIDLGAAYLQQGQPKEAQEQFAKLVAQDPNNAEAHTGLGMALEDQQNHSAAIDEYKNALRIAPQAAGVNYRVGLSQAQLKQYDEAIASYLKEREQNGDDPDLEDALAEAYEAKGMTQQAQEARNKAAQLKSGHGEP